MVQIQKTIFLLCIASAYAASIHNMSSEEFTDALQLGSDERMTQYDSLSSDVAESDQSTATNGFEIGKIIVQAFISVLQIVKRMDVTEQGMKSVSLIVARMISFVIGRYYETFQRLMPMISMAWQQHY